MSDIIHLLPDHIANQIAAGEVIQRPASVVKELMENAVDAEARRIIVHIKDAGRTLIQVIDDGKGMSETDARMAFERHATSKIATAQDLYALRTMGFRGEALASIAAVAQVELRTRLKGAGCGTKLLISGSMLDEIQMDACNEGSTFSVKNLFYNVPARRKFLKSNEAEFRNIMSEFERIVLVNHSIEFILFRDDTEVRNLPVSPLRQRIVNVFGKKLNESLLSFDVATSLIQIKGYIGRPDSVKRRGALNYFFVNGRYMRHSYFHRAVTAAYEPLVPTGEVPDYFLYMTVDPSAIDVNIHPTKTEIKFENETPVWQIISSAIREALGKCNAIPTIDFDTEGAIEIPVYHQEAQKDTCIPNVQINHDYNPFHFSADLPPLMEQRMEQLFEDFSRGEKPLAQRSDNTGEKTFVQKPDHFDENQFTQTDANLGERFFAPVTPCFQYKNRFIITSLKSGLVLIDQHRAHVRILYEQYISNIKLQKSASQQVLFPEIVEFTPAEANMIPSLMDEIEWLGFDLSPMGANCYAINGVPAGVRDCNPAKLIKEIIQEVMEHTQHMDYKSARAEVEGHTDCTLTTLSNHKSARAGSMRTKRVEILALSLAKSAAISLGKSLTTEEMESIIASLFSLDFNNLTPDGKMIMSVISDNDISKSFG